MPSWSADRELELACKVGSIQDFDRALNEGADVNCDGGSPLFLCVMHGYRPLVERLIAAGADPTCLLPKPPQDLAAVVEALMQGSPAFEPEDPDGPPKEAKPKRKRGRPRKKAQLV